ncbi:MAG: hypothetical protein HY209_03645 [Candidatus Omnitrophica bacterium]|nr:hypothetical protein [Candidatus Omnitrophota bacterium]
MNQPTAFKGQQRHNFYIDKDFQTKFIIKFCLIVCAGALLTIAFLYYLARLSTTVAIINSRVTVMTTSDFIMPLLIQTVIVVMVFVSMATIMVTLFVSHKIAGPLYRFKQTFKELSQGRFTNQVKLREGDQLQEVAGDFNQMITTVRTQVQTAQEQLAAIKKDVEQSGDAGLKGKFQQLEKAVNFFKV